MFTQEQKKIFSKLVEAGLLKEEKIGEVEGLSKTKNKSIREILIAGGFVEEEALTKIYGEILGYDYINLAETVPEAEVFEILPGNLAEKYSVICFKKEDNLLHIAMVEPQDINAHEALEFWAQQAGYEFKIYICSTTGWQNIFSKYATITKEVEEALGEVKKEEEAEVKEEEVEKIEQVIKKAPVSKIVNLIFSHAVKNKASDIHIEPFENETRIRYRIDGVLQTTLVLPISVHDSLIARIKVLADLKIDETRVPQDGRIKLNINKKKIDIRVSIMPLMGREKATMRLLDTTAGALTLADLGFSKNFVEIVMDNISKPFGMFLVTGPTGSGKSTTLYSVLDILNKEGVNIVTLEDPVEYYSKGVNQAQIRQDVGFTFASGLRAILRQDPDIIMVGEIRDSETAEMAVHAALTGHLLFSTLHTNDSVGAVPRLMDMKVESFLLASVLNAVIAQRLARRVCPKCKEKVELPKEVKEDIKRELKLVDPKLLPAGLNLDQISHQYLGKGCEACKGSGYKGRVVIAEILPISEKMRKIIAEGFKIDQVKEELARIKMISLLQDGLIKVLQGITSAEEVFRVAAEVEEEF